MFAVSSGTETLFIYVAAAVLGAIILGLGRAGMKLIQSRQTKQRNEEYDQRTLSEYFFDSPRDPRTGAPAKEGWTTKTDRALSQLAAGQAQTSKLVHEILYELKPNGGGNFRGLVERVSDAASTETEKSIAERNRVQIRDDKWDRT